LTPESSAPPSLTATAVLASALLAALAGALGGSLAALLLLSIDGLQQWIWGVTVLQGLPSRRPALWCLLIPSATGLLLSLLQGGQHRALLPEFAETLAVLRAPAALPPTTGIRPLLGGVLALIGGGSLGPEALATHLVALVSRSLWRGRDQRMERAALVGSLALFQTPLAGPAALIGWRGQLLWRWLPGILAGLSGFLCFRGFSALGGRLTGVPYTVAFLDQHPLHALLATLLSALAGCLCGLGLRRWRRWLMGCSGHRHWRWTPSGTGLLLGLALWWLPLVPFSGEHQLRPLLLEAWGLSPAGAMLCGLLKLVLVGLCLETGWRGGAIFPTVLGASAIGLGLHGLLPQLGPLGVWCGGVVGGCLGVLMRSPLVALVLGLTLLQGHGAIALGLGVLLSQLAHRLGSPEQPQAGGELDREAAEAQDGQPGGEAGKASSRP